MRVARQVWGALAIALAGSLPVAAEEGGVWLSGPEVALASWGTRSLTAADLNGNGLTDLIVADNEGGRVRIFFQRAPGEEPPPRRTAGRSRWEPVLEDARFREETLPLGAPLSGLAVGDLDGNGRPDLILTTGKEPLVVLYQDEPGQWRRRWTADGFRPLATPGTLVVADVDADGRQDLVVLAQFELLVFRQLPDGRLAEPRRYLTAEETAHNLLVRDLDGDERPDLGYLVPNQKRAFRVRLQLPPVAPTPAVTGARTGRQATRLRAAAAAAAEIHRDGDFGPELALDFELAGSGLVPVKLPDGADGFAYVDGPTRRVEIASLGRQPVLEEGLARWSTETYSTGTTDRQPARFAWADLDGDGRLDLVAGDPRGSRALLFRQRPDGRFGEAIHYPTLANLSALAAGDFLGLGRAQVAVASDRDELAGVARWQDGTDGRPGRLAYPEPLSVTGTPVALAAMPRVDGQGHDLVVVAKQRNDYFLERWSRSAEAGAAPVLAAGRRVPLPELRRDPEAILLGDLTGDGQAEVILVGRDPLQVWRAGDDGGWTALAVDSPVRRTLLAGLELARVTIVDLNGDGRQELVVGDQGLARVFGLVGDDLVVQDQLNARQSEDRLVAPASLDLDANGQRAFVFATVGGPLQALRPDGSGVFRFAQTADLPTFTVRQAWSGALAPGQPERLVLFGTDRFLVLSRTEESWTRQVVADYETDLDDVRYVGVDAGDLSGDGRAEVIAIDPGNNVVEVLAVRARAPVAGASTGRTRFASRPTTTWALDPVLHFTVFDQNSHTSGGRRGGSGEPREVLLADVTGDARTDLILLVHDRLLIYPQTTAPEATAGGTD